MTMAFKLHCQSSFCCAPAHQPCLLTKGKHSKYKWLALLMICDDISSLLT